MSLFVEPRQSPTSSGSNYAGAKYYFYLTGTTTPAAIYTDAARTTQHANPVTADSGGVFAPIWLNPSTMYRRVLKTAAGVTVSDVDPYPGAPDVSLSFNRTDAEIAAGVTPTNYAIPSHTALGGMVLPERYGFTGSVSATDTAAFANALLVADQINTFVGLSTAFTASSQLTWPADVGIVGSGRTTAIITKGFNGDLFAAMPSGGWMQDIGLDGEGATYTGRLLPILGTAGKQSALRCDIVDANGYCIEFETGAGSQSCFEQCRIARYDGLTAGKYSVKISDTQQLSAKPRRFIGCETDGTLFIDFGGSNNTQVISSFTGGFAFNAESRAVAIIGSRIANQASLTIDGHQIQIIGCDIAPNLTLQGTGPISLAGNSYQGTITDNTTTGQLMLDQISVQYTPTWTGAGGNPAIGNGTLRGEYTRKGSAILVTIEVIMGGTTTYGSGTWSFSLPVAPALASGSVQTGIAFLTDSATTTDLGVALLTNATTTVDIRIPGGLGVVNPTTPWTWANGDSIRIQLEYQT